MDDRETYRARYQFRVTYYPDGTPWITIDALEAGLPCFKKGSLGYDLKPDTTIAEAQALVEMLNEKIVTLSYSA